MVRRKRRHTYKRGKGRESNTEREELETQNEGREIETEGETGDTTRKREMECGLNTPEWTVIDLGSHCLRLGLSGSPCPSHIIDPRCSCTTEGLPPVEKGVAQLPQRERSAQAAAGQMHHSCGSRKRTTTFHLLPALALSVAPLNASPGQWHTRYIAS